MNFILNKLFVFAIVFNSAQAPAQAPANLSEPKIPKRECLFEGDIIGIVCFIYSTFFGKVYTILN